MISILIDKNLKKYRDKIEYSFNFIFGTIGYLYRFVNNYNELRKRDIVLFYSTFEPTIHELSTLEEDRIMFFIPVNLDLLEEKVSFKKTSELLKEIKLYKKFKIFTQNKEMINVNVINKIYFGKFNFDILGNIFYFLSQSEKGSFEKEKLNMDFEKTSNFQEYAEFPFVNAILWLLDNFIKEAVQKKETWLIKKEFWPGNQPFAVSFVHSVDKLQKWNLLGLISSSVDDMKLLFSFNLKQYFRNIFNKIKYIFTDIEPYWLFYLINEIEKKHNIKSTYFAAAEHHSYRGSFDYDINEREFILELKDIKTEEHEIALLCNKNAKREEIEEQKKSLELVITERVNGVKIYNSYPDIKKIKEFENLQFNYDSSVGFSIMNGFYNGIAFPYYLYFWNENERKTPSVMEFQNFFNDDYLLKRKTDFTSADKVKTWFKEITENLVFTNGHIVINTTIKGFFEIPYLEKLYSYIIETFQKKGAYIATLENAKHWWLQRNEIKIEEFSDEIRVFFPSDIDECTLNIVGKTMITEVEDSDATFKNNTISFKNIKAGKIVSIKLNQEL